MNTIKVAIVEDTDSIRRSLLSIIESAEGITAVGAYENAELAVAEIPATDPDIVLMDINLPGINGIECIKQLKEQNVRAQILMCTIYEDDEKVFEALTAGASGYILKNTSPVELIEAIRNLYNGGSPMSSQIARKVVQSFSKKPSPADELKIFTERELQILDLLAKGFRYKEIADKLEISTETVRRHVHNIYEKLHVSSRTDAINKVYKNKFMSLLFFFTVHFF